jgi:hypothetical protein
MLADALYRLRALFRRSDLERELDEELQLKAAARIACPRLVATTGSRISPAVTTTRRLNLRKTEGTAG